MANIIDGKQVAKKIKDELIIKVKALNEKLDHELSLAVVMVGNNPASEVYVKCNCCGEVFQISCKDMYKKTLHCCKK